MFKIKITDEDVISRNRNLLPDVARFSARGAILNSQNQVGLIYMSANGFYKLPGGGIETNETKETAFQRETEEETGYKCKILCELGCIEEHKFQNNFLQVSYCFIGKTEPEKIECSLAESEKSLGFEFAWTELDNAIELFKESISRCGDYTMKFMLLREKIILEHAKSWIENNPDRL